MAIKTIDIDALRTQTGNIYESVVILSKRARQIAAQEKAELDERLSYFEGFGPEVEDARMLEEQARVSLEFERRPKPPEVSIDEMLREEVFFRHPEQQEG